MGAGFLSSICTFKGSNKKWIPGEVLWWLLLIFFNISLFSFKNLYRGESCSFSVMTWSPLELFSTLAPFCGMYKGEDDIWAVVTGNKMLWIDELPFVPSITGLDDLKGDKNKVLHLFVVIFKHPYIKVTGWMFVLPRDLANCWTDMVLLYNVGSHRYMEGL